MAALVVSPPVSPLASPTAFLSDHREVQPDPTALFDDVLAAWASQQSRTAGWDLHPQLEEPSSYPFPSLPDDIRTVPDIPSPEVPQGADYLEFTSPDYETLFFQPDLATLFPNHSQNVTFNGVEHSLNNSIVSTQPMLPVTCFAETTETSALCQEPNNTPFPSLNEEDLRMQDILFEFNDGNLQKAPSSPESNASNPGSAAQLPPERASGTRFDFGVTSNIAALDFSIPNTPMAPSMAPDWTVATPLDEQYSDASTRKRHKTKELQHNNKLQYKDQKGSVIGTLITLGHDKVVRQPYSAAERAQTKTTRQRGACIPCRSRKKRCNRPESAYECCSNCKLKVLSMPCFVAKIIDAQLFRDKPSPKHPLGALRRTVFESLSDISHVQQRQRPIIVNLTQDMGLQMLVALARYDPIAKEVTHRVWKKDEQTRHIELPPYCIANMEDAQRHMLEYIANFRSAWLKNVLGRSNDITRSLFDQAQRFAAFNPESTVSKALDLCAASRIIERDWRICGGPADLGIPLVSDDETNPFFNCMPITPMMDAQLDQIVIRSFLLPTRDALLASLQAKMTSSARSSSYFEIFLTVSVLLSHAEWLLAHSRQNARRVGAKTRYNYIPRAEAYFHACNTIIAYWHYMCQGTCPAEMKWMDEAARKWAGLDQEQAQFLEGLRIRVNANESKSVMLRLRAENMYESELYWCHQIFFPNWKAGAKVVMDESITT